MRLEPKMMDVLCYLAEHAGEVRSKDEIASAVWPNLFITESVITRAISGLRRAFEDDARSPRFIQTIAKRGYRLLATPERAESELAPRGSEATAPTAAPEQGPRPFVVGQWVRGEDFFGRREILDEVLHGARNGLWLLGTRAIGKTSTLRQLELLTAASESPWVSIFLDLQGVETTEELDAVFGEVLEDASDRLQSLGVDAGELAKAGFLGAIGRLRRTVKAQGRSLLLLIDEAEELNGLHRTSPSFLRKLRRALLAAEGIRTVLAASPRLWQLTAQRDDTSPFLHGFAPPLPLGPFSEQAGRDLLARHRDFDRATIDRLFEISGGHPSLLQWLARRVVAGDSVEAAEEAAATDPTVQFVFAVDFDLLPEDEQSCLVELAAGRPVPDDTPGLRSTETLGLVQRDPTNGKPRIACPPFARWLRQRASHSPQESPPQDS